jgi:hypothetical protein
MVPASPLLTPHPPSGVCGEVGGINPADLYPKNVNADCCFEVEGANPLKQLSVVFACSPLGFLQETTRGLKPAVRTVDHLRLLHPAQPPRSST